MKNKNKNSASLFLAVAMVAAFFISIPKVSAAEVLDSDQDGLSDADEISLYYTDPNQADTDGDGVDDYTEIYHGYSPREAKPVKLSSLDSDADGVPDSWEIRLGLDLLNPDTDGDGYGDGVEVNNGYNPKLAEPKKLAKKIKVNLAEQKLAYYFGGVELEKFLISSGVKSMPTPEGSFTVLNKVPSKNYGGVNFYYPNTKWNLHFTTQSLRYYIHGAYWHNKFGRPMSHGCVNVSYGNMERLYNFAEVGTEIEID